MDRQQRRVVDKEANSHHEAARDFLSLAGRVLLTLVYDIRVPRF